MSTIRSSGSREWRLRAQSVCLAILAASALIFSSVLVTAGPVSAAPLSAAPLSAAAAEAVHHNPRTPAFAVTNSSPNLGQWRSILTLLYHILFGSGSRSPLESEATDGVANNPESYREVEELLLAELEQLRSELPQALHGLHDNAIAQHADLRAEHDLAWALLDAPEFQTLLAEITQVNAAISNDSLEEETDLLETWLMPGLQQADPAAWQAYKELQAEIAAQDEIYWNSPAGSQAEATATAELQRLSQEAGQLLSSIYPEFTAYQEIQGLIELEEERYIDSDYGSEEEAAALAAKAEYQREIVALVAPLSPEYAQFIGLQLQMDEQSQIYAEAAIGSTEESNALTRIEALEAEANELVAKTFPAAMEDSTELENQRAALQERVAEQIDLSFPALAAFQQLQYEMEELGDAEGDDQSIPLTLWAESQLSEADPEAAATYAEYQVEYDEQNAIYWDAAYGSEEEAEAEARIAELDVQMNAILASAFPAYDQHQDLQDEIDQRISHLEQEESVRLVSWLAAKLSETDAAAAQEMAALQAEAELQDAAYWQAESGSEAEAEAEARLAELEAAATVLLAEQFPGYANYAQLQIEIEEQDALYWAADVDSAEETAAEEAREALKADASTLVAQNFPEFAAQAQQMQAEIAQLEAESAALISEAFPGYSEYEESQGAIDQWLQLFAELEQVVSEENAEIAYLIQP